MINYKNVLKISLLIISSKCYNSDSEIDSLLFLKNWQLQVGQINKFATSNRDHSESSLDIFNDDNSGTMLEVSILMQTYFDTSTKLYNHLKKAETMRECNIKDSDPIFVLNARKAFVATRYIQENADLKNELFAVIEKSVDDQVAADTKKRSRKLKDQFKTITSLSDLETFHKYRTFRFDKVCSGCKSKAEKTLCKGCILAGYCSTKCRDRDKAGHARFCSIITGEAASGEPAAASRFSKK